MKKAFVKPMLKSYALNKKENILASRTWNDGKMSTNWLFHQYDPADLTHQTPITGEDGCFDVFDNSFDMVGQYDWALLTEGDWNSFTALLSRFNRQHDPDTSPEAEHDWILYQACRRK